MKPFITIFLLHFSSIVFSQTENYNYKLTFDKEYYTQKDTLGDLIITKSEYPFYKVLTNIVFTNKKISNDPNFIIKGTKVLRYNDTTLIIKPYSPIIQFEYFYQGDTLRKDYKVRLMSYSKLNIFLDEIQSMEDSLNNFKKVKTLSFQLEKPEYYNAFPKEDFDFTLSKLDIYLVRERRPVKEKKFKGKISVNIDTILKKGKTGDRLVVEYYPEWIDEKGNLNRMGCGQIKFYTLGNP